MADPQAGLLVIDKPAGQTSHDVVNQMRRKFATRRVGHAGTLDPMATGVLILGVNRATKLLTFLTGADKQYQATIRLGASTTTDDAEGEILVAPGCSALDMDLLESRLSQLQGEILQVPSAVSAIKINGQRAYKRVRNGETVNLKARPVVVSRFEIVGEPHLVDGFIDLDVIVDCSSGTYIRALARDLGDSLGVGGHLRALRRTRVATWTIDQATSVDDPHLIDLTEVCLQLYPSLYVGSAQAKRFNHGQAPTTEQVRSTGNISPGINVLISDDSDHQVIGLVEATIADDSIELKTALVISPA